MIEKELPHPPEKVWRALTEGPLIKEWLMDNDFQPVVGHSFIFRSTPMPNWNGVIDGEVLVVEPNKKLSYSWGHWAWQRRRLDVGCDNRRNAYAQEQSGLSLAQAAAYKGANYGWQKFIAGLERVVAGLQQRRHRKGGLTMEAKVVGYSITIHSEKS